METWNKLGTKVKSKIKLGQKGKNWYFIGTNKWNEDNKYTVKGVIYFQKYNNRGNRLKK